MKLSSRLKIVAIGLSLGLLASGAVNADTVNFRFTKIADTKGNFSSFSNFNSSVFAPAINNAGIVAFSAELDAGGEGIFSGDGTPTTIIADTSRSFTYIENDVSINDAATIAFIAYQANQTPKLTGVFTGNGTTVKTVITTPTTDASGQLFRANSFREPSINNAGTLALIKNISS